MKVITILLGAVLTMAAMACGNLQVASPATTVDVTTAAPTLDAGTPTPAAGTPTPPVSPPQVTDVPITFVTPSPPGPNVRSDCPPEWVAFRDLLGVISVCAPNGLVVQSGVDNRGAALSMAADANGVSSASSPPISIAVRVTNHPIFTPDIPLAALCADPALSGLTGAREVRFDVLGVTAQGCEATVEQNSPDGPLETILASATLPAGRSVASGFLNLDMAWPVQSASAYDLIVQILATLVTSS